MEQDQAQTDQAVDTGVGGAATDQERIDRIVKDRLARAEAKHAEQMTGLQAELDKHRAVEEKRRAAEMSDVEKLTAERDTAHAEVRTLTQRLTQQEQEGMRRDLIQDLAPALPRAYRSLVTGSDHDGIVASITEALAEFEKDTGSKPRPSPIGTPGRAPDPAAQDDIEGSSPLQQLLAARSKLKE